MSKYETSAGYVTRGETYAKIIDLLDQVIDQCSVMAHLHNTEGNRVDAQLARGWLAVVELMQRMRKQITALAMSKLQ